MSTERLILSEKYKAFLRCNAPVEFLEGTTKDRLISRCARGKCKSAYGFLWRYKEGE